MLVVGAAVLFGLVALWPERADVWYLNDASVHRSMVRWAADRIRDGHLPFDGWYPYLSLGASRFHHYQSLPHIVTGALSVVTGDATFRWSLYLLLAFWPVSVYAGGRLLGLGRWPAAAAALIAPLLSSVPGLGYEWGSYVWRGSGTWAQLWGMWALPFAWGLCWQAIALGRRTWLAALMLGLTICVHLLTGYLALCCLVVFVAAAPRQTWLRLRRAAIVVLGALLASAWMLVPLLTDAGWVVNDEFSRGSFFYDSFGARTILTWLATGALFDEGRWPLISALVGLGLVFALIQARRLEPPRIVIGLGLVSMLLFFGRPTLGRAIDLLPGGGDLFLRRFISGVHLTGIYLAGIALAFVVNLAVGPARRWSVFAKPAIAVAAVITCLAVAPAVAERLAFQRQGAVWVAEQARFEATDGVGFEALVARAEDIGPGRIFSELRGPGRARYRIGQVPSYVALLNLQTDAVGFTRPTWSLASPAEYRFNSGDSDMRDLFGVRYIIWNEERVLPSARRVAQVGRHVLWEIPDTGYLEVVETVAPIAADRSNIGLQTASVLRSGLYAHRFVPTLAFAGREAAEPTLGPGDRPTDRAGRISSEAVDIDAGAFSGTVELSRDAVVLVKTSFDPRWRATVDGEAVGAQMLSPGLVGIPVPQGEHEIALEYQPYPFTGPLLVVGAVGLGAIWYFDRRRRADLRPPTAYPVGANTAE